MKSCNNKKPITEQDVQQALEKFRKQGRLITKLPPQVTPRPRMVGEKHGTYETISALSVE